MKTRFVLRPLAASALLLAAACGSAGSDNVAGNDEVMANEAFGDFDEALPGDADEAVALVSLPPAPANVPAAAAAPLAQAAAIAREIDDDDEIERVPFEGGWAWRRNGRIVRTASRDGRRVSWVRPGESTPFLVQRGEETFAYRGGRAERAFDRRGRPAAVSAQRQEEARRLAEESRREREQAERAPRRPNTDRDRSDRNENRAGDGRAGNRTDTARPDRGGQGNRLDRDDRRDDRRRRGDDSTNRQ